MDLDVTDRDIPTSGLIVIGPPLADGALDDLLASAKGQVVLVEPDPSRALRLRALEGVRVIDAAIGQKAGQNSLVQFNFPGLRSLFAPTAALKEALPGLREVGRMTVAVMTPAELAQELEDLTGPLALHVNAPGAEMTILEGLAAHGFLARVAHLQLRCGTVPMVEGAASRAVLQDWVLKQGFTLTGNSSDDPDWAELDFHVDLVARALDETRAELATSIETGKKQQTQIAALEKDLSDSRAALKSREADLAKANDERDTARGQAENRSKRIAELENTVNETRRTLAETEKALGDAQQNLEEKSDALKDRDQKIATLEKELSDSRAALKSREAELAKANDERDTARGQAENRSKRIAELENTVNKAQEDTQQAKSDLGVALRMQMLAQSDLQELQVRFREVEKARASQQALLEKLTPRLQQAAHQLQQLHLAENNLDVPDPAAIDDQGPTDESAKPPKAKPTPKAPRKAQTKTTRKPSKKTGSR